MTVYEYPPDNSPLSSRQHALVTKEDTPLFSGEQKCDIAIDEIMLQKEQEQLIHRHLANDIHTLKYKANIHGRGNAEEMQARAVMS